MRQPSRPDPTGQPEVTSYATVAHVPVEADELEVQRVRGAALAAWFTSAREHHLQPVGEPSLELVDDQVVRVHGRVAIAQYWLIWGPVVCASRRPAPVADHEQKVHWSG